MFKDKITTKVTNKINFYKDNYVEPPPKLSVKRIRSRLKDLGKKYAFVPVDKASNNVTII